MYVWFDDDEIDCYCDVFIVVVWWFDVSSFEVGCCDVVDVYVVWVIVVLIVDGEDGWRNLEGVSKGECVEGWCIECV